MSNNEDALVDQALRSGNPDDAARVLMTTRSVSLDEARKLVGEILRKRAKK